MGKDVLALIESTMPSFSKGQKRIGNYIKENYQKAAFMTALKLGETVGVSESTVVRFATEIGFEGYPQLQKNLQEMTRNRLTSVQRMEVTNERIGSDDVLTRVLQTDIDKIKNTMEEIDKSAFDAAVASIIAARKIFIIGIRSAAVLSGFLNYYFTHIFDNVHTIDTASTSGIFEQMMRIGPEDVFLGITFSRYSKRTVKAAAYARDCGAKVIAITDSYSAPICAVADHVLIAKSDMASFVDSLVAPLSLINALIVAIGLKKKDEISATYQKLETIWEEYSVYETGEGQLDGE
ncbi:MurR/RpiR family transcriptional regulator [Oscillospiraceae bacterium MB08-C2-2]|nr:MurR/RpiR family transcriptional regulator [Oscillospiraceae bacterium MB08-C2-2]